MPVLNGISLRVPKSGNSVLAGMGYLDVTATPYNADKTGTKDSTAVLQQAIDDARVYQMVAWFPAGTYLVSQTLVCAQEFSANIDPDGQCSQTDGRMHPCYLMGSSITGQRPVITLKANAPGFGDVRKLTPVVKFFMLSSNGGSHPPAEINDMFIGIDITVQSGNDGAIGISFEGAQGSGIQDSKITMHSGHTGILGGCGGGGGHHNIEVVGGVHGLDLGEAIPSTCVSGATFSGQTSSAIIGSQRPVTFAGLDITVGHPGPAMAFGPVEAAVNGPDQGILTLHSASIRFTSSHPANVAISSSRSVYMNKAYFENAAAILARPDGDVVTAGNVNGWKGVQEAALCLQPPPNADRHAGWDFHATYYLDGVNQNSNLVTLLPAGSRPPVDLISQHKWGKNFPTFETTGAVNVKTAYGAAGDGVTDDTTALQTAIKHHDIVFLPKGYYRVTRTITLGANTQLIGAAEHLSMLTVTEDIGTPASPVPVIATENSTSATVVLAFCGVYVAESFANTYALNWQAGAASIVRSCSYYTQASQQTRAKGTTLRTQSWVVIQNHGGGRWWNHQNDSQMKEGPAYRELLVTGTSQQLTFYALNAERKSGARADVEISNSHNVTVFAGKSEGGGYTYLIDGSSAVGVFGYSGLAGGGTLFQLNDCSDTRIVNAWETVLPGTGRPQAWHMVGEIHQGTTYQTAFFDRPVLYRRS